MVTDVMVAGVVTPSYIDLLIALTGAGTPFGRLMMLIDAVG